MRVRKKSPKLLTGGFSANTRLIVFAVWTYAERATLIQLWNPRSMQTGFAFLQSMAAIKAGRRIVVEKRVKTL